MRADRPGTVTPMRLSPIERHDWRLSPSEAIALQKRLAARVALRPLPKRKRLRYIGGVDLSFPERTAGLAAVCVYDVKTDETVEENSVRGPVGRR